ncbi:hypothetical protein K435DRAFT_133450 [Dendrothele bispora CBS 962.96]|uniref:Cora-domain-containing protein n=1 Tax=Dendrothele bispora (strain CBS 962.96) TaxID=1314807 RepID=A0A4S8M134_DENBC|nr:hypothetical protein K435DRAFT_133450 [Dendrothele bispora CBS 962.96]
MVRMKAWGNSRGLRVFGTVHQAVPWPWLDLSDPDKFQPRASPPRPRSHNEWSRYPQAQFANWTQFQQEKSGIASLVRGNTRTQTPCSVYKVNIYEDGTFHNSDSSEVLSDDTEPARRSAKEFWDYLKEPPSPEVRVRAFFVDQLSGPVLQMLGTKFHIEPFFFSSSLNLIPTQYQEQVQGDHITITLQFIRPIATHSSKYRADPGINIQGPLELRSEPDKVLLPDFLAFHIVRRNANTNSSKTTPVTPSRTFPRYESADGSILNEHSYHHQQSSSGSSTSAATRGDVSTIISYHRPEPYIMTTAKRLHDRLLTAGHSVYWSHIYKDTTPSGDPNFIALTLLWYALYSWDEVYELLFSEVTLLESETLSTIPSEDNPNEDGHSEISKFSHKLHVIRAHLLHHESLLIDFRKRVIFLRDARHPTYTGKTGFAENTIYGSGKAAKRRYSARTGGIGPLGPVTSPSSSRRRSSASEQERERDNSGQTLRPLAIPTPILPTEDSIYEEPESDDHSETQEMLKKAKTEEGFREVLLFKECANLIHEIDRVERSRDMLDRRLANLVGFAFSSINIEDSKRMRMLAERSGRDSAVMKQISYLTMFFLPASVVATVLGMSTLSEIDHKALITFFAASLPLTGAIWFLVQYDPTNRLNIELLRTKLPILFVSVALGISKYVNKWNSRNMEIRLERMEQGLTNDQRESA